MLQKKTKILPRTYVTGPHQKLANFLSISIIGQIT